MFPDTPTCADHVNHALFGEQPFTRRVTWSDPYEQGTLMP